MPGQKDGWKDGRMDRPYFIGPSHLANTGGPKIPEEQNSFSISVSHILLTYTLAVCRL